MKIQFISYFIVSGIRYIRFALSPVLVVLLLKGSPQMYVDCQKGQFEELLVELFWTVQVYLKKLTRSHDYSGPFLKKGAD